MFNKLEIQQLRDHLETLRRLHADMSEVDESIDELSDQSLDHFRVADEEHDKAMVEDGDSGELPDDHPAAVKYDLLNGITDDLPTCADSVTAARENLEDAITSLERVIDRIDGKEVA